MVNKTEIYYAIKIVIVYFKCFLDSTRNISIINKRSQLCSLFQCSEASQENTIANYARKLYKTCILPSTESH